MRINAFYQRALAHRLGFEPGPPDYETTTLPTEVSRLLDLLCYLTQRQVLITVYVITPSFNKISELLFNSIVMGIGCDINS